LADSFIMPPQRHFYGLIILLCSAVGAAVHADSGLTDRSKEIDFWAIESASIPATLRDRVVDNYEFSGLAGWFNRANWYLLDGENLTSIDQTTSTILQAEQWFIALGRYNVIAVSWPGLEVDAFPLRLVPPDGVNKQGEPVILEGQLEALVRQVPELEKLRYAHLGTVFGALARGMEWLIVTIQRLTGTGWGMAIILFSLFLKFVTLPISRATHRGQLEVARIGSLLAPRLAEIKAQYDGEEAHTRIMAAHRDLGVTPFYTLRPMIPSLIQIPILVAVFSALGEMPQLAGTGFLWIDDLTRPDNLARLPTELPMLGDSFNLLPLFMAFITLLGAITYKLPFTTERAHRLQRYKMYVVAFILLLLFYPFPAAMVLYWTLVNIFHFIQQWLQQRLYA